jgi:hypothetical protein
MADTTPKLTAASIATAARKTAEVLRKKAEPGFDVPVDIDDVRRANATAEGFDIFADEIEAQTALHPKRSR